MARFVIPGQSEILVGDLSADILPSRSERRKVAVLTQPGAAAVVAAVLHHLDATDLEVHVRELPDREGAKSLATVGEAYEWLASIELGRGDTILGIGGGALTDVAGFVAATWLRGIEAVYVATTLLGAVDAAIGGKTGINVAGKNLVGAFWHPARVLIDPRVFMSLDPAVLREGFAESLKAGYIVDTELARLFQQQGASVDLTEVVERAVRVKVDVVTEDFREHGRRAILNYGHTLGHGIEVAAGLSHGDAVAIGMIAAAAVSARRTGFDPIEEHRETISGLGLPTTVDGVDVERVLGLVALDKKRTADGVRMVLLADYGQPVVEVVTEEDLRAGLAAVGIH